jgi:hypothetical protein
MCEIATLERRCEEVMRILGVVDVISRIELPQTQRIIFSRHSAYSSSFRASVPDALACSWKCMREQMSRAPLKGPAVKYGIVAAWVASRVNRVAIHRQKKPREAGF